MAINHLPTKQAMKFYFLNQFLSNYSQFTKITALVSSLPKQTLLMLCLLVYMPSQSKVRPLLSKYKCMVMRMRRKPYHYQIQIPLQILKRNNKRSAFFLAVMLLRYFKLM